MRRICLLLGSLSLMVMLFAVMPFGIAFASGGPGHYVGPNTYKGGVAPNTTCASAPSEANCTGQDPVAGGCQADAYTYLNGNVSGIVELRYSTKCQSNWSRYTAYQSIYPYEVSATVIRPAQTVNGVYYSAKKLSYWQYDVLQVYTDMVYAPGTVTAQACGLDGENPAFQACTPLI